MSQIEDHIGALAHMDGALAAMRVALKVIRDANEETVAKVTELWGSGNDLAGTTAGQIMAAQDHLNQLDMMLMGSQVEAVHALVILQRASGNKG